MYPDTAPHVMVYVPVGCETEDCEVPEPVIVTGPVIVHEDEMFEETLMVPTVGAEIAQAGYPT
ncbi:MAG: hypothetical protein Q7J73_05045 [Dehalococcoidales bacterium]|nr:hypothetical protein [Dehalococcoidales bacterium]